MIIQKVTVFTTRADTLFGVTYLTLAPEHPLVSEITTADQKEEVDAYVAATASRSDLDRSSNKEKTGVFTGGYAIHPFTKEEIPIWIGDYVLGSYGTGAVMAVPAHDERDFEFASKFGLDVLSGWLNRRRKMMKCPKKKHLQTMALAPTAVNSME